MKQATHKTLQQAQVQKRILQWTLNVTAVHTGGHIHVAIRGPVAVYSMRSNSDSMQCIDLSAVFPYPTSIWSPQLNLAGLGNELEGQLLVQDVNVSHTAIQRTVCTPCESSCVYCFVVMNVELFTFIILISSTSVLLYVLIVQSNLLLLINPRNGSASEIVTQSLMKKIASKLTRNDQEVYSCCNCLIIIIIY